MKKGERKRGEETGRERGQRKWGEKEGEERMIESDQ